MSSLVGKPAPDFSLDALLPDATSASRSLLQLADGHACLLVFYPHDFDALCCADLLALNQRIDRFRQHDCAVVGVSVDSLLAHRAWCERGRGQQGIGALEFALLSDPLHEACRDYGVLSTTGASLKAAFVIDAWGIVRAQQVTDLPVPLSIEPLLEAVIACHDASAH